MGHNGPKPDRWPIAAWKARCQNIGQMIEDEWVLFARCGVCGVRLLVDAKQLRKVMGRSFSPWNRRPRCRVADFKGQRCSGRVVFEAKPSGLNQILVLQCGEPPTLTRPKSSANAGP